MASQPMPALAASAMNALAHAVEALYTPLANPVSSAAALRSAELIAAALLDGEPDRPAVALGALLAGYASGVTGYAVHHVVCQATVRLGGTPHAETNATVLAHSVRLMRSRAPEEIEALERALGGNEVLDRLAERAGVSGLRALGLDPARADDIAAEAAGRPELQNTPSPPDEQELRALVQAAV
jgi:alcohol dehydrogenase class IV